MHYVAHGPDHALIDHLRAVADRAARCAPAGAQLWAHQAGLWHDLGKFRPGFQRYIREDENAHIEGRGVGRRDKTHSAAGAVHALQELKLRFGEPGRQAGWLLAHLIAAHHTGLYDAADLKDRLLGGGRGDSEREHREAAEACAAHDSALLALPDGLDARSMLFGIPGLREMEPLAQSLWLRMLFSALVDADFLDTEAYLNRGQAERRPFLTAFTAPTASSRRSSPSRQASTTPTSSFCGRLSDRCSSTTAAPRAAR